MNLEDRIVELSERGDSLWLEGKIDEAIAAYRELLSLDFAGRDKAIDGLIRQVIDFAARIEFGNRSHDARSLWMSLLPIIQSKRKRILDDEIMCSRLLGIVAQSYTKAGDHEEALHAAHAAASTARDTLQSHPSMYSDCRSILESANLANAMANVGKLDEASAVAQSIYDLLPECLDRELVSEELIYELPHVYQTLSSTIRNYDLARDCMIRGIDDVRALNASGYFDNRTDHTLANLLCAYGFSTVYIAEDYRTAISVISPGFDELDRMAIRNGDSDELRCARFLTRHFVGRAYLYAGSPEFCANLNAAALQGINSLTGYPSFFVLATRLDNCVAKQQLGISSGDDRIDHILEDAQLEWIEGAISEDQYNLLLQGATVDNGRYFVEDSGISCQALAICEQAQTFVDAGDAGRAMALFREAALNATHFPKNHHEALCKVANRIVLAGQDFENSQSGDNARELYLMAADILAHASNPSDIITATWISYRQAEARLLADYGYLNEAAELQKSILTLSDNLREERDTPSSRYRVFHDMIVYAWYLRMSGDSETSNAIQSHILVCTRELINLGIIPIEMVTSYPWLFHCAATMAPTREAQCYFHEIAIGLGERMLDPESIDEEILLSHTCALFYYAFYLNNESMFERTIEEVLPKLMLVERYFEDMRHNVEFLVQLTELRACVGIAFLNAEDFPQAIRWFECVRRDAPDDPNTLKARHEANIGLGVAKHAVGEDGQPYLDEARNRFLASSKGFGPSQPAIVATRAQIEEAYRKCGLTVNFD